ncbi:MAG: hypothetical protein IKB62_07500, partial [Oscillospiraceae bacterium]|nr:hypothetical protein [Oscillospiraceae bacterium]
QEEVDENLLHLKWFTDSYNDIVHESCTLLLKSREGIETPREILDSLAYPPDTMFHPRGMNSTKHLFDENGEYIFEPLTILGNKRFVRSLISEQENSQQNSKENSEQHSEVYNGIMQGLQEALEYTLKQMNTDGLKQKEDTDGK